ncbi:MAG: Ig-like domain-containing protein, partial [Gemmatimonadota bacterium]|nr:Ig-like domain-containing protein [Gemmatimonadota bacterium]
PGIVTVNDDGVARGIAAGSTEIRHVATNADGRACEATVSVHVRRATIARIVVESTRKFLAVGESIDVVATAWDSSGALASDAIPVWKSSDARVASVDDGGRVTALAPGRLSVSAEVDGRDEQVEMVVVAAPLVSLKVSLSALQGIVGVPVSASAIAKDATGKVSPALQWSVLPPQHARISAAGELVPLRAGMLSVTASIPELPQDCVGILPGTRTASATFEVREPRVESIKLDRDSVVLRIGSKCRIGAQVAIEGQKSMQRAAVNWSSNNSAIVRVLDSGELEAVALGDCTVLATSGEAQATLAVLVKARRFAAISLRTRLSAAAGVVAMIIAVLAWPAVSRVFNRPNTHSAIDSGNAAALQPPAGTVKSANGNGKTDSVKAAEADRAATARPSGAQAEGRGSNTKADDVKQVRSTVDTVSQLAVRDRLAKAASDSIRKAQAKFKLDSVAALRNAEQRAATQRVAEQRAASDSTARADSLRRAGAAREGRGQLTTSDAPNMDDVRADVDRILQGFRTGSEGNAEVRKLLSDRRPSVDLVPASVAIVSEEQGRVHAKFEVRLSSFNGVGIPKTRTAQVTFDVAGRRGATEVRNVQIGPLTKIP